MMRRPPRSTRTTHSFPTRRSSDLAASRRAGSGWKTSRTRWPGTRGSKQPPRAQGAGPPPARLPFTRAVIPHDTAMHLRNMDIIPTGPVPGSQRLELLDALRGFALAGVLVAHLEAFSPYYILPPAGAVAPPTLAAARWLAPALQLLVTAKFITLFSPLLRLALRLLLHTPRPPRGPPRVIPPT